MSVANLVRGRLTHPAYVAPLVESASVSIPAKPSHSRDCNSRVDGHSQQIVLESRHSGQDERLPVEGRTFVQGFASLEGGCFCRPCSVEGISLESTEERDVCVSHAVQCVTSIPRDITRRANHT